MGSLYVILGLVIFILLVSIRVIPEYERAVIFRLGRLYKVKGPGLIFVWPIIDRAVRVSLRTVTMDVPPQDVITKDNVSVSVNAVVYFRVVDPAKAVVEVEDYLYATSQIAQTTLRSVLGQVELDELLSSREKINMKLQEIIDQATDPWGVKVSVVEIKHVDLPEGMQRAMARQAEAERERRAKVISAEGEYQAAQRIFEAAKRLGEHPVAIQLRFLQSLSEIASEGSRTIVLPIPIELFKVFTEKK